MSVWDKISNATKFTRGGQQGAPVGGGAPRRAQHWLIPWMVLGAVVAIGYVIYVGLAQQWAETMERRMLALLQPLALLLVLVSVAAFLVGWALMKMPAEHWLAAHGKRLLKISPMALVSGAAIVPVALVVLTLTQDGASQMTAKFLGQKPAANFCAAAGVGSAPPPVVAPTPHR